MVMVFSAEPQAWKLAAAALQPTWAVLCVSCGKAKRAGPVNPLRSYVVSGA